MVLALAHPSEPWSRELVLDIALEVVPSFRALLFGRGGGAGSELGKLKDGYFSSRFRKQR